MFCYNEIAEEYRAKVNKYEDSNTKEWAATPYVGSIAEVDREIPTMVSPIPARMR